MLYELFLKITTPNASAMSLAGSDQELLPQLERSLLKFFFPFLTYHASARIPSPVHRKLTWLAVLFSWPSMQTGKPSLKQL